jgi:DNA-binding MarR family transcriptional regulator
MGELFSRRIAPFGVTLAMYRVMAALWENGDQRLSDLATVTTTEISTLSRLVGEMKRKGLVTRSRLEDNGRAVAINLTSKGKSLVEELMPIAVHTLLSWPGKFQALDGRQNRKQEISKNV